MSAATRAAQRLLGREFEIVEDGKWGRYTQRAYETVSSGLRAEVDDVLRDMGTSAEAERARRLSAKTAAAVAVSGANDVQGIIRAVADQLGVSQKLMLGFARIESNFNPRATNGSSKGLFQIQPAAWADAKALLPDLPNYEAGVFDPRENSRAAATYIKIVERRLRRFGMTGEISPSQLYLAYQQGAGGLVDLWKRSNDPAYQMRYVTERTMAANPPQDGLGTTKDPVAFYRRWLKAAESKLAL